MTHDYRYLAPEEDPKNQHTPWCRVWDSHDPCDCQDSTAARLDRIHPEPDAAGDDAGEHARADKRIADELRHYSDRLAEVVAQMRDRAVLLDGPDEVRL